MKLLRQHQPPLAGDEVDVAAEAVDEAQALQPEPPLQAERERPAAEVAAADAVGAVERLPKIARA